MHRLMLAGADLRVYLPLRGFADSLNLSVAAALCLHQLFHLCPEAVGDMSERARDALRRGGSRGSSPKRQGTRAERKAEALAEKKLPQSSRTNPRDGPKRRRRRRGRTTGRLRGARGELVALEAALSAERRARRRARDGTPPRRGGGAAVASPPPPLRDMRRADDHREAFVGKGVKARNAEHWEGMPRRVGRGREGRERDAMRRAELF